MPIVKLTFSGGLADPAGTAAAIRGVLHDVLAVPTSDGPVCFYDLPAASLQLPPGWSRRILVEVVMFPGRTVETKGLLIAELTRVVAAHLGADATDVMTTLVEPGLDNWGIRGGQQASQVALGFKLDR